MSTTTITPLVDRLHAEFFDGRSFAGHHPSDAYAAHYREDVREAMELLAREHQGVDITTVSDTHLGDALYRRIEQVKANHGRITASNTTDAMREAVGRWIKATVTDAVSPGNYPLPKYRQMYSGQVFTGPYVEEWASDDVFDIQPTVEEQITYLHATIERSHPHFADIRTTLSQRQHYSDLKEFVSAAMKHKAERLLPPGTRFTVKDAGIGDNSLGGISLTWDRINQQETPFTVKSVGQRYRPNGALDIEVESNTPGIVYFLVHHVKEVINDERVSPGNDEPEAIVEVPDVESLRREVQNLKAEVERLTEKERGLMRDGRLITEGIAREAEERSWCREYEQFAEEMNQHLRYFEFEMRDKEFEVTIAYTVSDSGTRSYTVSAQDEDSALEQAREMFQNESETDLWDHGNGSYNVEEDDAEVNDA